MNVPAAAPSAFLIPILTLPAPERLAAFDDEILGAGSHGAVAARVNAELSRDPAARGLPRVLGSLLSAVGGNLRPRREPCADDAGADWERNDLYFGVQRNAETAPGTLLECALVQTSLCITPFLAASSLSFLERQQVLRPLTLAAVLPGANAESTLAPAGQDPPVEAPPPPAGREDYLVRQWLLGHQYFFVLDQLLIAATLRLREALDARAWDRAAAGLRMLRELLLASSAAMSLVGDMRPEEYVGVIRPHVRAFHPDMSALNQVDHMYLQRVFRECDFGRRLKEGAWPAEVSAAFADVQTARALLLTSHLKICERAVGMQEPSIRSEARNHEQAAVKTISALNRSRAHAFAIPAAPAES